MSTPDYIADLMRQLQAASSPQRAIQLLADAADTHPADARPLLLLAAEFMELRDVDRAEAAYVSALQRAPEFWIARFQLGLLQFTSGRPVVAMTTWAPLDRLEEEHPLRLFKEGLEQLAQDRFEQARLLLCRGIAANTENPPLNRDMELLLEKLMQQVPPRADSVPQPAVVDNADEHVLLAGYRKLH